MKIKKRDVEKVRDCENTQKHDRWVELLVLFVCLLLFE